jgi:hypothetical protein
LTAVAAAALFHPSFYTRPVLDIIFGGRYSLITRGAKQQKRIDGQRTFFFFSSSFEIIIINNEKKKRKKRRRKEEMKFVACQ